MERYEAEKLTDSQWDIMKEEESDKRVRLHPHRPNRRDLRLEDNDPEGKYICPFEHLDDEGVERVHEDVRQAQRASAGIGNPCSSGGFVISKGRGAMIRGDKVTTSTCAAQRQEQETRQARTSRR